MNKSEAVFFMCECEADALVVERVNDDDIPMYEIACWTYGHGYHGNGFGLKERLHFIWQIIKEGHPFCDYVIFDQATLDKLIKHLQEIRK